MYRCVLTTSFYTNKWSGMEDSLENGTAARSWVAILLSPRHKVGHLCNDAVRLSVCLFVCSLVCHLCHVCHVAAAIAVTKSVP